MSHIISYTLKICKNKSFNAKLYLIFIFFIFWFYFSIYIYIYKYIMYSVYYIFYITYVYYIIYEYIWIYISNHKWFRTQKSAQISQKQDGCNIHAIMKTMCPSGYHYDGFVATHVLGHMMYGYTLLILCSLLGLLSTLWFIGNSNV